MGEGEYCLAVFPFYAAKAARVRRASRKKVNLPYTIAHGRDSEKLAGGTKETVVLELSYSASEEVLFAMS